MITAIDGVILDGTTPATDEQAQQVLTVPEGEYSEITITVTGEDGEAFDLTGYEPFLCVRRSSASDPIINRLGSMLVAADGTAVFVLTGDDTDSLQGNYYYDVFIVETATSKAYRVVPRSRFVIADSMFDVDDDADSPGPAMSLIGVPAAAAGDLGKVVVPTDDDPFTLAWTASPFEVVTGNAAIDAGALIKASSTAGRYETLDETDAAGLLVGVAKTACSGAASTFQAYFISGIVTPCLSDGTGVIAAGAAVEPSTTVSGRVKGGSTNLIGYNVGAAVAATLDAAVSVR